MHIVWNDEYLERQLVALLKTSNAQTALALSIATQTLSALQETNIKMSAITDILTALEADEANEKAVIATVATTLQSLVTEVQTLVAAEQANPADPTVLARLQALQTSLETDTASLSAAVASVPNPLP